MSTPLRYSPALNLSLENASSVDFSRSGRDIAVATEDGSIMVWEVTTGKQYYPVVRNTGALGASCILWLNNSVFVCGFANGYLVTCELVEKVAVESLLVMRQRLSKDPIRILAYDSMGSRLVAVCGDSKIRIWVKNTREGCDESGLLWRFSLALPGPTHEELVHPYPMRVTAAAWLPWKEDSIVITYLRGGLRIWNIKDCIVSRNLNQGGLIYDGALCASVRMFVAVNAQEKTEFYDLDSGQTWSPKKPTGVSIIKSIHRGTGFVTGGLGRAELVDIPNSIISQVLEDKNIPISQFIGISGHQDEEELNFMIATLTRNTCTVWKTTEITQTPLAQVTGRSETASTSWFSEFFKFSWS